MEGSGNALTGKLSRLSHDCAVVLFPVVSCGTGQSKDSEGDNSGLRYKGLGARWGVTGYVY